MFIKEAQFALWVDFIERDFVHNELKTLIDSGTVNGATSNPAIFKNAFLNAKAYKEEIAQLKGTMSSKDLYERLAITDIQYAADAFRGLYDAGDDGFVSIEVDPYLAQDAKATIAEGKRLYERINRPNVMIKIPATPAGYEAMEALIAEGISVNATLVFTLKEAQACAQAFKKGQTQTKATPQSVISVFVSRLDRMLDGKLPSDLQTKAGILNAAKIYNAIERMNVVRNRTLFASTGVKGDGVPPHYYVSELLAPNSVNTTPLDTIKAFVESGDFALRLPRDDKALEEELLEIEAAGVTIDESLKALKAEGLAQFEAAFDDIMKSLEK